MNKKSIIVGVVIFLFGLGAGFFLAENVAHKEISVGGTGDIDGLSWQTYTSEQYGIRVKYPEGEKVTEENGKIELSGGIIRKVQASPVEDVDEIDGVNYADVMFEMAIKYKETQSISHGEFARYMDSFTMTRDYNYIDKIISPSGAPLRRAVVLYSDRKYDIVVIKEEKTEWYIYDRPQYIFVIYFAPTIEAHGYATAEGVRQLISFVD